MVNPLEREFTRAMFEIYRRVVECVLCGRLGIVRAWACRWRFCHYSVFFS
jgi:hypothetical protein